MVNKDLLWENTLAKIKTSVNSMIYETWFIDTSIHSIDNNKITIAVKTDIQKTNLSNRYYEFVQANLYDLTKNTYEIDFKTEEELIEEEKPTEEIQETKEEEKDTNKTIYEFSSNLRKDLTFETFVVGNSNRLAQSAAFAVAQDPGKIYNPLFIYGNSGLGKTHLMHAIGNYIEDTSNKKVLYIRSQQFIDDFVKLSRDNTYEDYFKAKYRNLDVLIIDDIQFLATAQKTQVEFFNTFSELHDNKKQIILSSDRSPNDLNELEDRLKTRFNWGLTINIYPPDLELRKNILKKKIKSLPMNKDGSLNFPDDVIDYIASNVSSDVRSLEQTLNRLMAYSFMMGGVEIDLKVAVEALKDEINNGTSEQPNILRIQKVVADYWNISVDDLKSKKRSANIAFPRQVAMYLSRSLLNESFERIGLEFGGKDHTTVMFSCEKIEKEYNNKEETRNAIEKIKEKLK